MKLSTIGLTTATVALLGVLAAPSVHAEEIPGEAKDTNTSVTIIDSPDPKGNLKLVHVPQQYKFETKLQPTGEYTITEGKNPLGQDNKITVFNDRSAQAWSVKASVDSTLTVGNKTATVTSFKINNLELLNQYSGAIVYASNDTQNDDNNTGNLSKEVTNTSISFNNEAGDLKAGDVLTGKIHYRLYNTPNAE